MKKITLLLIILYCISCTDKPKQFDCHSQIPDGYCLLINDLNEYTFMIKNGYLKKEYQDYIYVWSYSSLIPDTSYWVDGYYSELAGLTEYVCAFTTFFIDSCSAKEAAVKFYIEGLKLSEQAIINVRNAEKEHIKHEMRIKVKSVNCTTNK